MSYHLVVRCETCVAEERFGMTRGGGRTDADTYLRRRGWLVRREAGRHRSTVRHFCPTCRSSAPPPAPKGAA